MRRTGSVRGAAPAVRAIRQQTFEFIPFLYAEKIYAIRPGISGVHLWTGYFTISFKGVSVN